ncbi:MAG: hypothetical protein LBV17_01840 [Treponema sp.]|nr:hypothetical protein [Treponema sp.]
MNKSKLPIYRAAAIRLSNSRLGDSRSNSIMAYTAWKPRLFQPVLPVLDQV